MGERRSGGDRGAMGSWRGVPGVTSVTSRPLAAPERPRMRGETPAYATMIAAHARVVGADLESAPDML